MSAGLERLRSLPDDEAMALLVAVYVDGFCSGASSGVMTFVMNRPNPPDEEKANQVAEGLANFLAHGVHEDRLSYEEIRNQVRERLEGVDSGPCGWTLLDGPAMSGEES